MLVGFVCLLFFRIIFFCSFIKVLSEDFTINICLSRILYYLCIITSETGNKNFNSWVDPGMDTFLCIGIEVIYYCLNGFFAIGKGMYEVVSQFVCDVSVPVHYKV